MVQEAGATKVPPVLVRPIFTFWCSGTKYRKMLINAWVEKTIRVFAERQSSRPQRVHSFFYFLQQI